MPDAADLPRNLPELMAYAESNGWTLVDDRLFLPPSEWHGGPGGAGTRLIFVKGEQAVDGLPQPYRGLRLSSHPAPRVVAARRASRGFAVRTIQKTAEEPGGTELARSSLQRARAKAPHAWPIAAALAALAPGSTRRAQPVTGGSPIGAAGDARGCKTGGHRPSL